MTDPLAALETGPAAVRSRIRGYLPCRMVTNLVNGRGKVLVQFSDGTRKWFDADKVDRS